MCGEPRQCGLESACCKGPVVSARLGDDLTPDPVGTAEPTKGVRGRVLPLGVIGRVATWVPLDGCDGWVPGMSNQPQTPIYGPCRVMTVVGS
jgi:hypothetical protein